MGEGRGRSRLLDRNGAPRPDVDRHVYDGLYASCIRKCGDRNHQSGGSVGTARYVCNENFALPLRHSAPSAAAPNTTPCEIRAATASHAPVRIPFRRVHASALHEAISRHSRLGTARWTSIPLAEALFIFSYIMLWIGYPVAIVGPVNPLPLGSFRSALSIRKRSKRYPWQTQRQSGFDPIQRILRTGLRTQAISHCTAMRVCTFFRLCGFYPRIGLNPTSWK